jgi:hypothetical protein
MGELSKSIKPQGMKFVTTLYLLALVVLSVLAPGLRKVELTA